MQRVTGGALPAQAWHEFMVAAHEGVPVARLPGTWQAGQGPSGSGADPQVRPDLPLADAPASPAPISPRAESAGYAPPPQEEPTSSIRRIVPPGDVGAPAARRSNSILDILTGG
ncbi:hypothetical protein ABUE29_17410 [Mesorhizobium sp. ZMM04-4]